MQYHYMIATPEGAVLQGGGEAGAHVIPVPYINQSQKWPTGCESVSAVMLLHHLGIRIPVDDFIDALPKQGFEQRGDVCYGADPDLSFVGSPYDDESYGCYAPVIRHTLNRVLERQGSALRAFDATGVPMETLKKEQLDRGMPVIFWATIDLLPSRPGPAWQVDAPGGEYTFRWTSNEHCLLLVGMDEDYCWFNDPWKDHGLVACDRALVEKRHAEMRSMAVVIG